MSKERVNFRISSSNKDHLIRKADKHGISMNAVIEELIDQDRKKSSEFVDELADAIYKRLDDRLTSIRIAANENNKLLKVIQKVINYLLMAQGINMPYKHFDTNNKKYMHFAITEATEEVKNDIKKLQVIKAEARKNKKTN